MKVVIMAGGRGTRIAEVNSEVPKPMIPIKGKPILEYTIQILKEQGFYDIILVVGYLGHVIQEYFGDGTKMGVHINYLVEKEPLGTAGALYYLKEVIHDDFMLLNGDIIFDIDIEKLRKAHIRNGKTATILTHPNSHPYDSGVIVADSEGKVLKWLCKEDERKWYENRVNAGIHMLSPRVFEKFSVLEKKDLDRDILKALIPEEELYIYDSPEYVKDMGTPERLYAVEEDIEVGRVQQRNLSHKQKAVFLDRDGTINKYVGFLRNIDDFELIDGVADAIKEINNSGYLAIVITNQPVIARGEVTFEQLHEIHMKMETLLGQQGAYLDDIFYCPHHPHKGYDGEVAELKIECECRKPMPGLLFRAAEKFNIDLKQSWMIGDSENDVKAGIAAGCKSVLVGEQKLEGIETYATLIECVKHILRREE